MENNIIYEKSVEFSKLLLESIKDLEYTPYKHICYQIRKSGTAIGASIAEADSAQSMLDFISKMKIADKEANETVYWLTLLEKDFPEKTNKLTEPITEIKRILRSILITSSKRLKVKKENTKHMRQRNT